MKTIIAATLVLFSVSTSAVAFEIPNVNGLDGVQQLVQGKGKRSQRSQQQGNEEEGQGQQQSRQGGQQDAIKGLMNGDTSGLQGMMNSFGR
jgi:hypothetical protein